jgi:delta1-piperideine-2-carboxylate reductase
MKITIQDAEQLANTVLQKLGYSKEDAAITTHHLLDSQLRGYPAAGLARILSIADRLGGKPPASQMEVTREAPATAQLDGKDTLGYLVAHKATQMAIEKAKKVGVGVVGASGTWYTGMLCYYAEMAAANDLVTVIASNCTPWVAPEGGYKPLFGTNPFCVGFPSGGTPVIYDIGTSKIIHADAVLAKRLGEDLAPDVAFNSIGESTTNPQEALEGALAVWGGHKGTGLAIAVQLLGVLAGSAALPPELAEFGYLIIAINPANFRPIEEFKREIDEFSEAMRSGPPLPGKPALRMPYERSFGQRKRARDLGHFEVEDGVVDRLKKLT